ncbi:hypothetical protein [Sinorhizobium meliloti]
MSLGREPIRQNCNVHFVTAATLVAMMTSPQRRLARQKADDTG